MAITDSRLISHVSDILKVRVSTLDGRRAGPGSRAEQKACRQLVTMISLPSRRRAIAGDRLTKRRKRQFAAMFSSPAMGRTKTLSVLLIHDVVLLNVIITLLLPATVQSSLPRAAGADKLAQKQCAIGMHMMIQDAPAHT